MASSLSVRVDKLGKRYRRFNTNRPNTFIEALTRGFQRLRPTEQLSALSNVSFDVQAGQMVGIVGHNGAGKSTLLRLLGGVGRPDQGTISIEGRIGALLDLGVGFHPELTGRENVFVSGVIAGLTRAQVRQRFDAIVDFAELAGFIDSPLRTYSTGMQMRLAFAIAAHIDPDVLLIDEVLAVGDYAFQQKCLARIDAFRAQGCTILLVTHDIAFVRAQCDQALWLQGGEIMGRGSAETVIGQYETAMQTRTLAQTPHGDQETATAFDTKLILNKTRFGSQAITINSVTFAHGSQQPTRAINSGDPLTVTLECSAKQLLGNPNIGISITSSDGTLCYDVSTSLAALCINPAAHNLTVSLTLASLALNGGSYHVDVGIYSQNWAHTYDYHWRVYPLTVTAPQQTKGLLWSPTQWQAT